MKNIYLLVLTALLATPGIYAEETVFDSMENAKEVKLAPAIKTSNTKTVADITSKTTTDTVELKPTLKQIKNTSSNSSSIQVVSSVPVAKAQTTTKIADVSGSIKQQKFTNALVNLDDAQVELRQELAEVTDKYNIALAEKEQAIANCKNLKKEIKVLNSKMKNVDKSKKMINKSIEEAQ